MANGERDASTPAALPDAAAPSTATIAALCLESDDLLTSSRGLVAVRAAPLAANGHPAALPILTEEPAAPTVTIGPDDALPEQDAGSDGPIVTTAANVPAPEELLATTVAPLQIASVPDARPVGHPEPTSDQPATPVDSASPLAGPEPLSASMIFETTTEHAQTTAAAVPLATFSLLPSASPTEPPSAGPPDTNTINDLDGDPLASSPVTEPQSPAKTDAEEPSAPAEAFEPSVPAWSGASEDLPGRTNGIAVHAASTVTYEPITEPDRPDAPVIEATVVPNGSTSHSPVEPAAWSADASPVEAPERGVIWDPVSAGVTEAPILGEPGMPVIPPPEPPAPPEASAPPPAVPPPGDDEEDGASMTIIEHLEELRRRLTVAAISVVVGAVAGWFITPHVVDYLETGARKLGSNFFSPTILGPFGLELKLSFLIGLVIASPMVLYQIWAFVAPGLTRQERRYALPFSLIGGGLFAVGSVVGVLVVPLAIRFLTGFFAVLNLEQLLDIERYIMFIAIIAVIFGITFELPIFMVGFSLLGVVSSRFFIQRFKIAIFVIYGAAMLITPGADLVSPLVLGTFLIVLYWFGVLLIRIIGR